MVHCKRPFFDEMIYVEKFKNCRISQKLQEKIVLDNLLISLQLDIEFLLGGYSMRHLACEIREESQQYNYINDNVVCFTVNDVNRDAYNAIGFSFDVVSIYTDSEKIPVTRCYMHSVQCCREDCGTDFCLKVIKTMNKTYKCDISVSDGVCFSVEEGVTNPTIHKF